MPPNQTHYFTYCQIKAHQFKNPVSLNRMRQGQNQTPYHYGGTFKTVLSQCEVLYNYNFCVVLRNVCVLYYIISFNRPVNIW